MTSKDLRKKKVLWPLRLCLQPRAVHALRSDQLLTENIKSEGHYNFQNDFITFDAQIQ